MMLHARALLACTAACLLAACSNNATRALTAQVGVDTGVALSTAGSATSVLEGSTLALGASVENASNSDGVSWSLVGPGSLTSITTTSATYVAPTSGVTGSQTVLITATAIANPAQYASTALIVLGSPIIPSQSIFPGNVSVAYSAPIAAAGGESPFTWTVTAGALPAGLALNGSTSAATYITGTPTSAGSYSFTLQATDTLSRTAKQSFTMVVKPETACVLSGNYTFLMTGFRGGGGAVHAGSISIDANTGAVTGVEDYKDPHGTTVEEVLTSGTCVNRETNTGVLTLTGPTLGSLLYDFSATPPDSNGVIHSAGLQLIHSGGDSGSGQMLLQQLTGAPTTPLAGNYAFGLFGIDAQENHYGMIGRFTGSATGAISSGLVDANGLTALSAAALTGTVSAPDAHGRGTLTLQSGAQSTGLAYYIVDTSRMFLIDIDPTPSGSATTRLGGQMTAQNGNVSATQFDNGALATPAILSQFGHSGTIDPVTVMSLGRLSGANAAASTVNVLLDTSDLDTNTSAETFAAQSFSIANNGRGTLTLANTTTSLPFVFYLDGISNGYILQPGSTAGSTGLLEAQFQGPYTFPPASGTFPSTLQNSFVSYTAYPQSAGPITLNSLLYLNYDALSSNYINGSFAIDPTIGRGLGSLTESGVGTQSAVVYVVSEGKLDIMRFGTRAVDASIEFAIQ
jgi:hypothetical protein